ncbi:MAG: hypothetical protein VX736_05275 [Candidatus Neomarinimicrobiota bacterium]|nr:hypothetical protein [Candidatus Neomarinimicrobiota bacterium]
MRSHPLFFILPFLFSIISQFIIGQDYPETVKEFSPLRKRVYSFSKLDFITSEGEFNEAICTMVIPDLKENSPPFIAIYYRRENSRWFTESLYRKRLRFSFKEGVVKLDQSNFWDWFEVEEIKIVVIY